jgi:CheY-like chemotaxis protein
LKALGHRCQVATNGEDALKHLAESEDVELIITDYQMPLLTGGDLVRKMREVGDMRPVIVLTGYGRAVPETVHVKHENLLSKPVRMSTLRDAITQAIGPKVPGDASRAQEPNT